MPLQGLQREVEALAATLTLGRVQRKPWPLFKAVDFVWRAPAVFFFVVFLGERDMYIKRRGLLVTLRRVCIGMEMGALCVFTRGYSN